MADTELMALTADIVSAHVSHNHVTASEVPDLIRSVYEALEQTARPTEAEQPKQEPAVSIRSSVKHDHIVCLEDGAKLKMLKRYLRTRYAMSPEEYRSKWGLPRDYPMVAPAYAEQRKELAKKIGLGRKTGQRPAKASTPSGAEALKKARSRVAGGVPASESADS